MILWLFSAIYTIPGVVLLVFFSMDQLTKAALLGRWAFEKASGAELTVTLEGS